MCTKLTHTDEHIPSLHDLNERDVKHGTKIARAPDVMARGCFNVSWFCGLKILFRVFANFHTFAHLKTSNVMPGLSVN